MKILAINASHRGDRGYTRLFIDKLLQGAADFRTYSRFMNAPQVGVLVRNATNLLDALRSAEPERSNPRAQAVYDAYAQAGRDLATLGHIRRGTQRRANQEIVPVPLFGLLKRLPFRPLKERIVIEARKMQAQ